MMLSALVCPGTGQFRQGRWGAGLGFIFVFLPAFVWFFMDAIAFLGAEYDFFKGFFMGRDVRELPRIGILVRPFAVCLIIYLAGLADTAFAERRLNRDATGSRSRGAWRES